MSFLFASSHLPAFKRPQVEEEDEDDDTQPMQRSGGVRAISHLEEAEPDAAPQTAGVSSRADSPRPARAMSTPTGALSQRGAQPVGRSLFMTPRPPPPQYFAQMQARLAGTHQQLPPETSATDGTPGQAATPTFRNLQQRSSEEPPAQLLAQPAAATASDLGHPAETTGTTFQQATAKPSAPQQGNQSARTNPPARPASAAPPSTQTPAQGRGPTPLVPGTKPTAPAPASKPAPAQSHAAKGQPPQPQLTPEDHEEIYPTEGKDKGLVRKPIGQLGIKGGEGYEKDGRPKTVCLHDGSDTHQGKTEANALSLQRAAREYASREE